MRGAVLYRIFVALYIMLGTGEITKRVEGVTVAKKIRGVMFEENANNSMGLEFYNRETKQPQGVLPCDWCRTSDF